ncbi:MAG: metalloregulator ArsR/SmtB family transcription factor [Geminicoccaceae bacterium]
MGKSVLAQRSAVASRILKAMSNPRRLQALYEMHGGECSVGDLVERIGISQSAMSQHLARLRSTGIVTTRRDAQTIYYSLGSAEARAILETLYGLYAESMTEAKKPRARRGAGTDGSVTESAA